MSVDVDLGPVVYEAPLGYSGPWNPQGVKPRPLTTGPRWLRGASRWHRVRSGMVYPAGHTMVHAWCGQSLNPKGRDAADDQPFDGLPLCGTCEGRAAGAGHPSPVIESGRLLFRPMRLTPPRWCPGGNDRYGDLSERLGHRIVRCGACGETVRERNAYGWNAYNGVPQKHEPGPGLIPGCPQHAWRHLVRRDGRIECACAATPTVGE